MSSCHPVTTPAARRVSNVTLCISLDATREANRETLSLVQPGIVTLFPGIRHGDCHSMIDST